MYLHVGLHPDGLLSKPRAQNRDHQNRTDHNRAGHISMYKTT